MIKIFLQKFRVPIKQGEELMEMIENYEFPVFSVNWESIETVGDLKREIYAHALKNVVKNGMKYELTQKGLVVEGLLCPTINHIDQVVVHFSQGTIDFLKGIYSRENRPYYY